MKKKSKKTAWITVLTFLSVLGVLGILLSMQNIVTGEHPVLQTAGDLITTAFIFALFVVLPLRWIWGKICSLAEKYGRKMAESVKDHSESTISSMQKRIDLITYAYIILCVAGFLPVLIILQLQKQITAFLAVDSITPVLLLSLASVVLESRVCANGYRPAITGLFKNQVIAAEHSSKPSEKNSLSKILHRGIIKFLEVRSLYALLSAIYFVQFIDYVSSEADLGILLIVLALMEVGFVCRWIFIETLWKW